MVIETLVVKMNYPLLSTYSNQCSINEPSVKTDYVQWGVSTIRHIFKKGRRLSVALDLKRQDITRYSH